MTRPTTCYLICATPRSGSNLLCEALTLSGVAGMPQEYFVHWHPSGQEGAGPSLVPPSQYLERVFALGTNTNGVFGAKVMWGYFARTVNLLREAMACGKSAPVDVLAASFPDLRYVHMTRTDKVQQAVSLFRAQQSGQWALLDTAGLKAHPGYQDHHLDRLDVFADASGAAVPSPPTAASLVYDFQKIAGIHASLIKDEQQWNEFFRSAGLTPLRVTYEDLEQAYATTARRTLEYLRLPEPGPDAFERRVLQRQRDETNAIWVRRFREQAGVDAQ